MCYGVFEEKITLFPPSYPPFRRQLNFLIPLNGGQAQSSSLSEFGHYDRAKTNKEALMKLTFVTATVLKNSSGAILD